MISKTYQKLSFLKAYQPHKFENLREMLLFVILGSNMSEKKFGFRPQDPHSEIRAGILRRFPVCMSQMVGRRHIWWQKGVAWGPLGFRAQPAHLG